MYMIFSDIFTRDINDGDDIEIKSIISHDKHIFMNKTSFIFTTYGNIIKK